MKLIILAGGSGTRLWPVSRKNIPKQVQAILGEQTLLEKTYERLRTGFAAEDIYIATNQVQAELIKQQLKELPLSNYIIEPSRKDTAAAIGLAATKIHHDFPGEVIININSDHFVKDEAGYIKMIRLAEKVLSEQPDSGVLIGVNPTYPETGYGYIKMGENLRELDGAKIFEIAEFKEKPSLEKAEEYFKGWEYLWNIGCFAFKTDYLLSLYEKLLPEMHAHLVKIEAAWGQSDEQAIITQEFNAINPISMDYGIIEKAPKLFVIPADFGWADVGHWRTVKEVLSETVDQNVLKGNVIEVNSAGNLVYGYSNKLVALVGVKDMVVIETPDAMLICPRDEAQSVKQLVDKLKAEGMEEYL
ncbi:mannose-1-phosphate guanylyltransferase [Candidatus Falkowbacteria bacterium]|nr:mannose-1-phosphate guanylyltransferase [Candidatus Falkowbacteria bacterium]